MSKSYVTSTALGDFHSDQEDASSFMTMANYEDSDDALDPNFLLCTEVRKQ